ncbi:MAG TPA: penicillin-binding protein 2 [Candidatus Baltobacteraceae bacterium]|jgi:cell division protein FtsI/penicillin-binding protein 2|nr:penicillin-binding protein 2 [Candidatus Baltobacteraceae bacterium]
MKTRGGTRVVSEHRNVRRSASRAKLFFYILAGIAAFLVLRLFIIQVLEGPKLAAMARVRHSAILNLPAQRGSIYDRNGVRLVGWAPASNVFAEPALVRDKAATAMRLAPLLGYSTERILSALTDGTPHRLLRRKASQNIADRISAMKLPGIEIEPDETGMREIYDGRSASTVIGITGADDDGLEGLEYSFDGILRGKPGQISIITDEFNRPLPFVHPQVNRQAVQGDGIRLTIDSYLEFTTQQILEETIRKWHARSGTAIVMDPWSGAILALANAPDYDPQHYESSSDEDRRDRAITESYEPGSTFKLITAAEALDSGIVTPESRFPNRDSIEVGGRVIHNAEDGLMAGTSGSETLGDIIAYSHNVGAAEVALRIGKRRMDDALQKFGFGHSSEIELPGESVGIVPRLQDWSGTSLPTIAFGQGIAITPISLIRAYCAFANGGVLIRPRVVDAILDPDGRSIYQYGPEIERRVISAHTAEILRTYLRAVVLHGTGNPTAQVPGYTTAGKTGTAQIAENGYYSSGAFVASFVGMIPADRPRFVILVKVDRPSGSIYGSQVAAPAFVRIARAAMLHDGILPTRTNLVDRPLASKPSL